MLANEMIQQNLNDQLLTKEMMMAPDYVDDWHSHPWHQVVFPISGLLQSNIGDKKFVVPHNGVLFIPANTLHKSVAITQTQFLAVYLNPNSGVIYTENAKPCLVTPFLKALILLLFEQDAVNSTAAMMTHLLTVLRDQISIANRYEIPLLIPSDRRLHSIFVQLQKQPDLKLTLSDWANKVGASSRTLSRICSNEFKLSFSLWRKNIRLILSLQLLEEDKKIQEIAMDLGYQSDSAYIYAFKGVFTLTPSQYRKHNLSKS